jgi:hypothetical protein
LAAYALVATLGVRQVLAHDQHVARFRFRVWANHPAAHRQPEAACKVKLDEAEFRVGQGR